MPNEQKQPLSNRSWFVSIGVFMISQILFLLMEQLGWIPNYREVDGKLIGKVTELPFFTQWFQFYETQWFNILTLFFAVFVIFHIITSVVKYMLLQFK